MDEDDAVIASRKRDVEVSVEFQRRCTGTAQNIVLKCLEKCVSEEEIIEMVSSLNSSYYEDIVEERMLQKICGYPLCNSQLKLMPIQKYHISTKANKVYDITERRCFCSNLCYKRSNFLKDQLPSCPVWLIDKSENKKLKILKDEEVGGLCGREFEMDHKLISEAYVESSENIGKSQETLSSETLSEMQSDSNLLKSNAALKVNTQGNAEHDEKYSDVDKLSESLLELEVISTSSEKLSESDNLIRRGEAKCQQGDREIITPSKTTCSKKVLSPNRNDTYKGRTKLIDAMPEAKTAPSRKIQLIEIQPMKVDSVDSRKRAVSEKSAKQFKESAKIADHSVKELGSEEVKKLEAKQISDTSIMENDQKVNFTNKYPPFEKVKAIFFEWMTTESVKLILGEEEYLHRIASGKLIAPRQEKSSLENKLAYIEMCKRLDLEEKEEKDFDEKLLGDAKVDRLQPLPNFDKLKEETGRMSINVQAFFNGKLEYIGDENTELNVAPNNNQKVIKRRTRSNKKVKFHNDSQDPRKISSSTNGSDESTENNQADDPILPTVDHHSQMHLRKKIVMTNLNIIFRDVLSALELNSSEIEGLGNLVATFKLSAENITLKPKEWSITAFIILKLISYRSRCIAEKLLMQSHSFMSLLTDNNLQDEELASFISILLCD